MASLESANKYFADTYFSEQWTEFGEKERLQAINTAENQIALLDRVIIDRYGEEGLGEKTDSFIYEQARFILSLDEEDLKRLKLQAVGITRFDTEQNSEHYSKNKVIMVAGLPLSPDLKQALFEEEGESEIEAGVEQANLKPGDML